MSEKEPKKLFDFDEIFPRLIKLSLFEGFKVDDKNDKRILKIVFDQLKIIDVKAGEAIIKEGEPGENFYFLVYGKIKIMRNTMAGDKIALANLSHEMGVYFGEAALIGTDKRSATVMTETDCKLAYISGKKFKEICEKEPILGYRVMLCLAKKIRESLVKTNNDMTTLYEALFDEVVG